MKPRKLKENWGTGKITKLNQNVTQINKVQKTYESNQEIAVLANKKPSHIIVKF